jgi:hypothetical protein
MTFQQHASSPARQKRCRRATECRLCRSCQTGAHGRVGVASAQHLVEGCVARRTSASRGCRINIRTDDPRTQCSTRTYYCSPTCLPPSAVDAQLYLVVWNQRYEEMFPYPTGLLRAGVPVADPSGITRSKAGLAKDPKSKCTQAFGGSAGKPALQVLVRHHPSGTVLK